MTICVPLLEVFSYNLGAGGSFLRNGLVKFRRTDINNHNNSTITISIQIFRKAYIPILLALFM